MAYFAVPYFLGITEHANDQSVGAQAAPKGGNEEQGACTGSLPAEARRMHPCVHHNSKEAELRVA
jgi:hypothetical protein